MGDGGPRHVSASGCSSEGVFKAVYRGRFGKHNMGVAINYTLQRGTCRNVTSGARSEASGSSYMREVAGRRGGVSEAYSEPAGRVSCGSGALMSQKAKTNRAAGRRTPEEGCRGVNTRKPLDSDGGARASSEEGRSGSATRVGQRRAGPRSLSISRKGDPVQLCAESTSPEVPVLTQPRPGRKDGWHSKDPDQCNSSCLKRNEIKVKAFKPKDKSQDEVLKVITKMLEENEQLRARLLQCSQKCTDVSQQTGSVFGWI